MRSQKPPEEDTPEIHGRANLWTHACRVNTRAHTHIYTQMFVLTEPVHQLSKNYTPPQVRLCVFFRDKSSSKKEAPAPRRAPSQMFSSRRKDLERGFDQAWLMQSPLLIIKSTVCSVRFFRQINMSNKSKLLFSGNAVTKGDRGHTPASETPHISLIPSAGKEQRSVLHPPHPPNIIQICYHNYVYPSATSTEKYSWHTHPSPAPCYNIATRTGVTRHQRLFLSHAALRSAIVNKVTDRQRDRDFSNLL